MTEPIAARTVRKRSVDTREKSGLKNGTVKDLVSGLAPHTRGHGVTNMFGNPNPMTESLWRVGGESRIIHLTTHRFHPSELEERADVSNTSSCQENGLAEILGWVGDAVEDMSDVTHAEEPKFRGRTSAVHEAVDGTLEGLTATFEEVLMLMMCFTLPESNPKWFETVGQFPAGVVACVITKETVRSSPFLDEGLNGTEKTLGAGNGFNVDHV